MYDLPRKLSNQQRFIRHVKDHHGQLNTGETRGKWTRCGYCDRKYYRHDNHYVKFHSKNVHQCRRCERVFAKKREVIDHNRDMHGMPVGSEFQEIETAFGRRVTTFQRNYQAGEMPAYEVLFVELKPQLLQLIRHQQSINMNIRSSLVTMSQHKRLDDKGNVSETSLLTLRLAFKLSLIHI